MDMQVSLFEPTVDQFVEEMTGEIPELVKISEQFDSLTSCLVLTQNHVWYLQFSLDYSLESSVLLKLKRKNITQRTIDKAFKIYKKR